MNQRIKELAQQAGYYLYDLTETHEIKTVETDEKDEWITLEKFYESIVRECVRHFNEDYQRDFDTNWREDLSKSIKQHFGVKE